MAVTITPVAVDRRWAKACRRTADAASEANVVTAESVASVARDVVVRAGAPVAAGLRAAMSGRRS